MCVVGNWPGISINQQSLGESRHHGEGLMFTHVEGTGLAIVKYPLFHLGKGARWDGEVVPSTVGTRTGG